jgi:hypothetical protein
MKKTTAEMRMKYNALRAAFLKFWSEACGPLRHTLWYWDLANEANRTQYGDLASSVNAANRLGYDSKLEYSRDDNRLTVVFVKKAPGKPWELNSGHFDKL